MSVKGTEAMYLKVVAAALEYGPTPTSERGQDTLEPPWLVFRRAARERDALLKALEESERYLKLALEDRNWITVDQVITLARTARRRVNPS